MLNILLSFHLSYTQSIISKPLNLDCN